MRGCRTALCRIAENSLLTYVEQVDPIWVNFSVSENDMLASRTAAGRRACCSLPPNDEYEVEVVLADGSVYPHKGTHHVCQRGLQPADRHVPAARDASQSQRSAATRTVRAGARVGRRAAERDPGAAAGGAAGRAGALRRAWSTRTAKRRSAASRWVRGTATTGSSRGASRPAIGRHRWRGAAVARRRR